MPETKTEKETIVISLGGSIVVPDLPNGEFVKAFKEIILHFVEKGKKFVIIVGGGKTCRRYNEALSNATEVINEDLDWLGIYTTRLNAELVRLSFGKKAADRILIDPSIIKDFNDDVVIGAGWKPGNSTDAVGIMIAKELGTKKVVNISNIDYIYDSDPKINEDAKKFENISWAEYRSFISSVWKPGMNTPFDPIASEKAEEGGIEVAFMSGHNLESLENYLKGEHFVGTIIK
ncbi:MAG: UMP kinase [Candidatus Paceibacterota bacterium]